MTDGTLGDDSILRALMPTGETPPMSTGVVPLLPHGVPAAGAAGGTIRITPAVLKEAGKAAGQAGSAAKAVRSRLETAHDALGKGTAGFGFPAELGTLCASWSDRLRLIGEDCSEIGSLCERAAGGHDGGDVHVVDTIRSMR